MTSTLIAHCGTTKISRDELRAIPVPEATATHKPIPHFDVVQALIETLGFRHIRVIRDEYAVSLDGMKMFGALDLDHEYSGVRFSIGIRSDNFSGRCDEASNSTRRSADLCEKLLLDTILSFNFLDRIRSHHNQEPLFVIGFNDYFPILPTVSRLNNPATLDDIGPVPRCVFQHSTQVHFIKPAVEHPFQQMRAEF
jgi:hypothetical protein